MDMVDRISALPQPILHHILSLLPSEQVAQTSLLSKTWKETWFTFPILEFHDLECEGKWDVWRKRWKFEHTIGNRHRKMIDVTKFTLDITPMTYDPNQLNSFLDRCVCYAIESNVKELKLELKFCTSYELPLMVYCSKSVQVLLLRGCKLAALQRSHVKLSSLRKLYMESFGGNHKSIQNLVAGCPLIEELSIRKCHSLYILKLFGPDKLKKIEIKDNFELNRVEIEALKVESVSIVGGPCLLSKLNVASCMNIKCLTLSSCSITDECFHNQIRNLPLLEYLNIRALDELQRINIESTRLKTLVIRRSSKLVELKIQTPNLCVFGYEGELISVSADALPLCDVDLFINFEYDMEGNQMYSRYIDLLAQFHVCEVVNLGYYGYGVKLVIIPKEVRKVVPSPLSRVKHLNFTMSDKQYQALLILDGLLWIAPHVETIVINKFRFGPFEEREVIRSYCFQFSYYEEETIGCYKSRPVSCWNHCIKEVKVETHNEKGENVEAYSLERGDVLKKLGDITI